MPDSGPEGSCVGWKATCLNPSGFTTRSRRASCLCSPAPPAARGIRTPSLLTSAQVVLGLDPHCRSEGWGVESLCAHEQLLDEVQRASQPEQRAGGCLAVLHSLLQLRLVKTRELGIHERLQRRARSGGRELSDRLRRLGSVEAPNESSGEGKGAARVVRPRDPSRSRVRAAAPPSRCPPYRTWRLPPEGFQRPAF